MDRQGLVNRYRPEEEWEPGEWEPPHEDRRSLVGKILAPIIAVGAFLLKFGFVAVKFGSIFIAVAAYALIWGWKFGVGVVALILLHETGHWLEAKREGLHPKLPVFIPFFGAYVAYTRGHPWQTVRVAIAGPILGGAAASVFYVIGKGQADPYNVWLALGYFGFFLNLFNMIPLGFFDGGAVWRSAKYLRLGGGRRLAWASYGLYFATALMLVLGMWASHVPQNRL